ncbi:MAG: hypothetical protein KKF33_08375 [Alphaproteobacteria bacterium]|nr:hypothetical protein [Alphaproteobacteria bacterium]
MINEELIAVASQGGHAGVGRMLREFLLAGMIMAVGMSVAGAGTHLYQWLSRETAALRYDGATLLRTFGLLAVSFICGPYIILQMGWRQEVGGTITVSSALLSAFLGFGWSFITGLLVMSTYFAIFG